MYQSTCTVFMMWKHIWNPLISLSRMISFDMFTFRIQMSIIIKEDRKSLSVSDNDLCARQIACTKIQYKFNKFVLGTTNFNTEERQIINHVLKFDCLPNKCRVVTGWNIQNV